MEKIKQFFNLCESIGEGIHDNIHIVDVSEGVHGFEDEDVTYRVYHSKGYCLDVTRGFVEIAEDESCENLDGYWYSFMDDLYEGFKECDIDEAIKLLKNGN